MWSNSSFLERKGNPLERQERKCSPLFLPPSWHHSFLPVYESYKRTEIEEEEVRERERERESEERGKEIKKRTREEMRKQVGNDHLLQWVSRVSDIECQSWQVLRWPVLDTSKLVHLWSDSSLFLFSLSLSLSLRKNLRLDSSFRFPNDSGIRMSRFSISKITPFSGKKVWMKSKGKISMNKWWKYLIQVTKWDIS